MNILSYNIILIIKIRPRQEGLKKWIGFKLWRWYHKLFEIKFQIEMSQQKEAQDKKSMNFVTHKEINTTIYI